MAGLRLKPVSVTPTFDDDQVGEDIRDEIREWFFDNFEDPAQNTPHDSGEGGYQWIWGGPYDAREEIESNFSEVDPEVLDEIIEEIESEGLYWAPHDSRIVEEEEDDDDETLVGYQALQTALDSLEEELSKVEPFSPAIGGNNPPDEIGLPPYDNEDRAEIKAAIQELRKPATDLIAHVENTAKAAETVKTKGQRIVDFFSRHGDKFVENFVSQLGKRAADSLTIAGWLKFGGLLLGVYEAAQLFFQGSGLTWPF